MREAEQAALSQQVSAAIPSSPDVLSLLEELRQFKRSVMFWNTCIKKLLWSLSTGKHKLHKASGAQCRIALAEGNTVLLDCHFSAWILIFLHVFS